MTELRGAWPSEVRPHTCRPGHQGAVFSRTVRSGTQSADGALALARNPRVSVSERALARMRHVKSSSSRAKWLRPLGACVGVGLLGIAFARADWALVQARLSAAGPSLLLAVMPFALAALLDVYGLRGVLRALGADLRLGVGVVIHLRAEAIAMSLPFGGVASDPLRAFQLQQRAGVEPAAAIAVTLARKYLLIATEGVCVALGAWFGAEALGVVSSAVMGDRSLVYLAWGVAALLILLGAGYALLMRDGAVAAWLLRRLQRNLPQRFKSKLEGFRSEFTRTDQQLGLFFRLPARRVLGLASGYLVVWLLEALETFVALRLLGADVTWQAVLCMESLLSFVRAVAMVLPAGLGIQDLGYALFLQSLGVNDAHSVGAALAVFKRLKEAAWVALGYSAWGWTPANRAARASAVGAT